MFVTRPYFTIKRERDVSRSTKSQKHYKPTNEQMSCRRAIDPFLLNDKLFATLTGSLSVLDVVFLPPENATLSNLSGEAMKRRRRAYKFSF